LMVWSWIQLIILLLLTAYLFGNIARIGMPGIFLYGLFLFVYVYAATELMDGNKYALLWDIIKNAMGIVIIFWWHDWFGSNTLSGAISYILLEYFAFSSFIAGWILKSPAANLQR
jgi:alkylglycerol monooxygenase